MSYEDRNSEGRARTGSGAQRSGSGRTASQGAQRAQRSSQGERVRSAQGSSQRSGEVRGAGARSAPQRSGEVRSAGARSTQQRSNAQRSSAQRSARDEDVRRTGSKARRPQGGKKQKSKAGKIVLFAIELVVLAAMGVVLWTVLKTEKVGKVELDVEDIVINEELKEKLESTSGDGTGAAMSGYRNIALFGVDSREGALTKNTRSDTIMIASINMDTGECKLVSVYRDTYLNLSNDTYNKCNAAYAKGGPKQAINMLNMNLDMNITDFITVGFKGLEDTIDALGGIEINVQENEIVHLNNYQISMVGTTSDGEHFTANEGTDYTPVRSAGYQTLNGLQATAYCRIRYVGNDFQRTQRQRDVLVAILEKAKTASPATLTKIATDVFEETYTSLDLSDITEVLGSISKYKVTNEAGFPKDDLLKTGTIGKKGACIVPNSLYDNVIWLHEFMFNDTGYEPSSAVKTYSDQIKSETASYLN